ncbi:MAG: TetR family transcriptional regulator [Acidimicrobiales bacterium]|nr:MAG: TetR family transcriptional regulator [Acidimicrobiales bacterium]
MTVMATSTRRGLRRAVSEEDKQLRRAQILAAAKSVFSSKGFHATTIADVARRCGLSYGVVYWYFASKDELFAELMAAEEASLRERVRAALADVGDVQPGDVAPVLEAAVRAVFEHFEEDPAATRLLFREAATLGGMHGRRLSEIFSRFVSELEAVVRLGQERGEIRAGPPSAIAYFVAISIGHMALRRQRTDDGLSTGEAAHLVVQLVLEGITGDQGGSSATGGDPSDRTYSSHRPNARHSKGR